MRRNWAVFSLPSAVALTIPLQALHLSEPEHRRFSSAKRQVAVLGPVAGPAGNLLLPPAAKLIHGCPVGAQAIGGDGLG